MKQVKSAKTVEVGQPQYDSVNFSRSYNSEKNPKVRARGTRADVYNGIAMRTTGGLKKEDLILNSKNQIVSKKASEIRKKIPKDAMFKKK
jgi:hypothetical protein